MRQTYINVLNNSKNIFYSINSIGFMFSCKIACYNILNNTKFVIAHDFVLEDFHCALILINCDHIYLYIKYKYKQDHTGIFRLLDIIEFPN